MVVGVVSTEPQLGSRVAEAGPLAREPGDDPAPLEPHGALDHTLDEIEAPEQVLPLDADVHLTPRVLPTFASYPRY